MGGALGGERRQGEGFRRRLPGVRGLSAVSRVDQWVMDTGLRCSLAPHQHLCLEGGVRLAVTGGRGCCGHIHPEETAPPTTVRSQTELAFDTESHSSTGFPAASVVKNLPANAGDMGLIPGSGRFPWRKKWQPAPVCLLGKPMDRGAWCGRQPPRLQRVGHTQHLSTHTHSVKHSVNISFFNPRGQPKR